MNYDSINFSLGEKQVNLDVKQTFSFLTRLKQAGEDAIEGRMGSDITTLVTERFNDSNVDLDVAATKAVMKEMKDKISVLENKDLTDLFEQTLQIVNKLPESEPPPQRGKTAETFSFMGITASPGFWECGEAFKDSEAKTYAVYVDRSNYEAVWIVISQENKKFLPIPLAPDPDNPGGYTLTKKLSEKEMEVQRFGSISHFIADWTEKGRIKKPLEKPYNFEKNVAKQLKNKPYFKEMDSETAVSAIESRKPGTYLIRDKKNDREGKVVVYKDEDGDVEQFKLNPHPGPMRGYDCEGEWYPDIDTFFYDIDIKEQLQHQFKYTVEDIEARQQIAAIRESLEMPMAPLERKTEVFEVYREKLASGTPIQQLMHEALSKGEFEVAKWLAVQGADLEGLDQEAIGKTQKEQLAWLKEFLKKPEPSPQTLDHYALNVGYGYKSSNLMVQQQLVNQLNKKLVASQAEVPAFLPFSDFEMRQHMEPILPKVEELWNKFLGTFEEDKIREIMKEGFDPAVTPMMVKAEGKVLLEQIHAEIVKFFNEHPFESPELQDWIKEHPSDFLIIRSTGKEDTEQNPNPGGNETIPYISPDGLSISKAIGEVVASYFGIKSVTQRLMVGDQALFTEKPFLPVLVMNMVTEKVNGETNEDDITRSGVMFTPAERESGRGDAFASGPRK